MRRFLLAVSLIDAKNHSVVARYPFAFGSCGDGTTALIREVAPKTFEIADTIQTAPGGKTCALDPKTHTLWVAAGTRGKDDVRVLEFGVAPTK